MGWRIPLGPCSKIICDLEQIANDVEQGDLDA
jgi:hypothetical protein